MRSVGGILEYGGVAFPEGLGLPVVLLSRSLTDLIHPLAAEKKHFRKAHLTKHGERITPGRFGGENEATSRGRVEAGHLRWQGAYDTV